MTNEPDSDLNPEEREPEETTFPEQPPAAGDEREAEIFAEEVAENESEASSAVEPEAEPVPPAPPHLERLQKILAAAGVASRRHAEELIVQGRVEVNGKVVTELGSKADAARDHIRVDGKLLHGAERLRYFVLNKPKGYVTTVTDPEGRPTVMEFFKKTKERLYPVGRLDYMSEGLLVVTNDGALANRLTRASLSIEKVYLVKVAGQPTEAELDRLRAGGVAIDRGRPGSEKVKTAPAEIRQVRLGDNPWFEVVLIEGRNRELRKIFEQIGHHVEKIRRVGYGPLVLDLEPGHVRELDAEEITELRKAAEGRVGTPGARRRRETDLPTVTPRNVQPRNIQPGPSRPSHDRRRSIDLPARKPGAGEKKPFPRKKDREERPPHSGGKQEGRSSRAPSRRDSTAHARQDRFRGDSARESRRGPRAGRGSFEHPEEKRSTGTGGRGWRRTAKPGAVSRRSGSRSSGEDSPARRGTVFGGKGRPQRSSGGKPAAGGRSAGKTRGFERPGQKAMGRHGGRPGAKRGGPRPGGKRRS